jgi:hypothetical protein
MTAAGLTIFTALGDGSGNNPETPEQVTQNIKVTQLGTGAVQRSVHQKLLEVWSITDFGAVGDGTTDNTAFIQNAINAAQANGVMLYIPPGVYRTGPLNFGSNSVLGVSVAPPGMFGAGAASVLKAKAGFGGTVILKAWSTVNSLLRDFVVDCAGIAATGIDTTWKLGTPYAVLNTYQNVRVQGNTGTAWIAQGNQQSTFDNCMTLSPVGGTVGIDLTDTGGVGNYSLRSCYVDGIVDVCCALVSITNCSITGGIRINRNAVGDNLLTILGGTINANSGSHACVWDYSVATAGHLTKGITATGTVFQPQSVGDVIFDIGLQGKLDMMNATVSSAQDWSMFGANCANKATGSSVVEYNGLVISGAGAATLNTVVGFNVYNVSTNNKGTQSSTIYSPGLQSLAALSASGSQIISTSGADTYQLTSVAPYFLSTLTGITNGAGLLAAAGGQATHANLGSLSSLTLAADKVVYSTAINTLALADFTATGRTIVASASAGAARSAIGAAASGAITGSGLTMASARLLGRATAGTGALEEIDAATGRGILAAAASGSAASSGLTMVTARLLGRLTAGTGALEEIDPAVWPLSLPGKTALWLPAWSWQPRPSNPPDRFIYEYSTNHVCVETLDFDPTTNEYAQWGMRMPKSWKDSGATFTAAFVWMHTVNSTAASVIWGIQATAYSDDDSADVAWGTASEVTDANGTLGKFRITSETSTFSPANSPAQYDYVRFQMYRNAASASDTMTTQDARLVGVVLFVTTDKSNDA